MSGGGGGAQDTAMSKSYALNVYTSIAQAHALMHKQVFVESPHILLVVKAFTSLPSAGDRLIEVSR